MASANVLEPSLIKDLSNHIYEKRKATAFQIESLTKAALARNDSQTIYKIINELTELTNGGTNSAKMGSITALGSVSVALGSFAIAYFLEEIIKPIFATFRDTDARVRYYACESLYNIAKIARGEMLLYFNEVFDILCILVTDTESSVKNAADILDRLIKDIVSAKATNYVSILQQQEVSNEIQTHLVDANGVAIQVNHIQDSQKAFSLPKFIPTLLERIYTIDPFAKKFLISWLELFDDIPSLELITFLPNFLKPLIKFSMNNSPADVRSDTENILNMFLKEIKSIYKVKFEVKKNFLIKERKAKKNENKIENEPESEAAAEIESVTEQTEEIKLQDSASIKSDDTTIVRKRNSVQEGDDKVNGSYDDESTDGEIFLNGQDIFIDYAKIIDILLSFIRIDDNEDSTNSELAQEPHEISLEIQFIILKWLQEILGTAPIGFIKCLPECISIVLSNISKTDDEKDFDLRNSFLQFNNSLQDLLVRFGNYDEIESDEINENLIHGLTKEVYDEFVEYQLPNTLARITKKYLTSNNELSRITSLEWLTFLYSKNSESFFQFVGEGDDKFDLTSILRSCTDASNEVILKVLQLLSKISEANQEFFKDFMIKLTKLLEKEDSNAPTLSRGRVEFIIRKLCVTLNSERIFKTLSEVLVPLGDLDFLNAIIVTLNEILLTAQELTTFRRKLKNLDVYKIEDWSVFATLFQSWCHNAPSALSLCLLTSNYELAYLIIKNLSESEVNFQLLTQLDVLIQLIESPIFLKLRLQLLEPEKHPYLYKTLYGLLMILPQSSTFTILSNRLNSISHIHYSASAVPASGPIAPVAPGVTSGPSTPGISNSLSIKRKRIYEMLDKFTKVQERLEEYQLEKKSHNYQNYHSQDRDRLLSHTSSFEKKDYFSEQEKRRYQ